MNKILLGLLAGFALVLGSYLAAISHPASQSLGAVALQTFDADSSLYATTTLVTISPNAVTSTLRLGPTAQVFIEPLGTSVDNGNRKFASIQNVGNATVYCGLFNATTSAAVPISSSTYGFILNASTTGNSRWIAQDAGSLYVGQVWCAGGSATSTLAVEEAD